MFEKKGRQGMPSAPKGLGIVIGINGKPGKGPRAAGGGSGGGYAERGAPAEPEEPMEPGQDQGGDHAELSAIAERYGVDPEAAKEFVREVFALAKSKVCGVYGDEEGLV